MDRLQKWASGASLAWLAIAVGLILGTHSADSVRAQAAVEEEPVTTAACSSTSGSSLEKHEAATHPTIARDNIARS